MKLILQIENLKMIYPSFKIKNMYIKTVTNFLSKEECDFIIKKYFNNLEIAEVGPDSNGLLNLKKRNSKVNFVNIPEIKNKLINLINTEIKIKGFRVNQVTEKFQTTKYEINGHYDWHKDSSDDNYEYRFLSIIIQLNDDYTGGELQYKNLDNQTIEFTKGLGNLFIFSSNILHKVSHILEGERYSLVSWLNKEPIESQKTLI
jgi:predicted 2-oxoglutarate/Fe(II)-dependent dioxygenase YbiX